MMTKIFSTSVMVILTWWVFREEISALMSRKRSLCNGGDLDLISQLPDDVLVLIIARLSTKTAVTTSLLSKRWRNLYKSLSAIDLRCMDLMGRCPCPHGYVHYSRFDFGYMMHNFFLVAADLVKPTDKRFEQCIHYVGKSNVEHLRLFFHVCSCSPTTSFSCDLISELPTLKYLELGFCIPELKSKWNSLITLSLAVCTVIPGFWECILSNCLNLESLRIYNCKCPPKLCIRGRSLQLKTLSIISCESIEEIELHASNLVEFEYRSNKMANLVFDYVPKLEILYMFLTSFGTDAGRWANMMPYIFGEVAKYVPNLGFLTFATTTDLNQGMLMGRSRFGKLRVLNMTLDWTPKPSNLLGLIPYLESCSVLEELQLNLPSGFREVVGAVNVSKEVIELRKLKKVEINRFHGTGNEIDFALYILKNAPSLRQMCIIIRYWKQYIGPGQWRAKPLCEETCENNIKQSLLGQALSPTAKLIIRHGFN